MSTPRWMAAVAAVIVGIVVFGYFSWPEPARGPSPDPPDARIDEEGTLQVAFREGNRDDWDLVPFAEAYDRAQQELGFAFALPAVPPETLMPVELSLQYTPADGPLEHPGQYYSASVEYVLHPIVDDDGRVRVFGGGPVPARDDVNVPMTLSIEYPVSDLGAPLDAEEVSTDSIPRVAIQKEFVGTQQEAADWHYSWLIGDVRYQLIHAPALRVYPREEMLAIVEATAAGQAP